MASHPKKYATTTTGGVRGVWEDGGSHVHNCMDSEMKIQITDRCIRFVIFGWPIICTTWVVADGEDQQKPADISECTTL